VIKRQAQRDRTVTQIEGFRRALEDATLGKHGKRTAAIRKSYQGMIRQLEQELQEYDDLRSGKYELPSIQGLDQIAPFLVKLRIARRVTQSELARRLGVSKQVISRSEDEEYQTASVARLQQILDALEITAEIRLRA
jgi:HTH-type transcriptional regulator/antitoxin HigA